MFTEADYINGWLAYGGGAFVGFLCWWYLLAKLPIKPLRPILVGAMGGLLSMPWYIAIDSQFLAPAWLIASSEGFFEGIDNFWRAGTPMIVAVCIGALLGLVIQIICAVLFRSTKVPSDEESSPRSATPRPSIS